jgi:hypothetical protein
MVRSKRTTWSILSALGILVGTWTAPLAMGEINDALVRRAIENGVAYLKKNQKVDGSWTEHPGYPGGLSALCTLALLNCGEPVTSPTIQKALQYLRGLGEPQMVYSTSLITQVLCVAEPERDAALIRTQVNWLEKIQIRSGRTGSWAYSEGRGTGDNSNAQFALLALYEADRVGVQVQRETWDRARAYWEGCQNEDGSWGYYRGEPPTGSMTCAGIGSLVIASGMMHPGDARIAEGHVTCCGTQEENERLKRALAWMGAKFSAERNPTPSGLNTVHSDQAWLYYYLYGIERIGRLTGSRFLGTHDWFREGAEFLVARQDRLQGFWRGETFAEQNPLVTTSFALLFLSKGRRPVVLAKLQHGLGEDWDRHRAAIPSLTRRLESRWKRDLTWQTIDLRVAQTADLLETPVLFLSGSQPLEFTPAQRQHLKEFLVQGGFLFAEASCSGEAFDRSFRQLMKELFPDSQLRLLPPEHPVWYAEQRVDAKYLKPLYGLDACCRTSVVYCPENLSCYWELGQKNRQTDWPADVQAEVEAALRIGANVVTYATNRELKNKLDRPEFVRTQAAPREPERAVLYVPKLRYGGGGDDAPAALPNLLNFFRTQTGYRVGVENRLLAATDPTLFDYPILFMHGRRDFRFTPEERQALRLYLQRGGVLIADAICGSPAFASAVRRELGTLFPDQAWSRLAPDHPLFTDAYRGFDVRTVTLRNPQPADSADRLTASLQKITPLFESLTVSGRIGVILSPYDLSCALENGSSLECLGYVKDDAARLATNLVLFAMQQ